MKYVNMGNTSQKVPAIILGLMRVSSKDPKEVAQLLEVAMENGVNFFDHADIYGGGKSESVFAEAVKIAGIRREDMIIQSKCSIVPGKRYDFSCEHIVSSVEGSLKRLNTDHLDVLLLHRPDPLMEGEEVAKAFDLLEREGKVLHFGVSNQNSALMRYLQSFLKQPILFNQMQMSICHTPMINVGMHVNMMDDGALDRDGDTLIYMREKGITMQAWSPFQYGMFQGVFLENEEFPELNKKLEEIAEKYGVSTMAVAVAWLLRHPMNMQVIAGTTNKDRLAAICQAVNFTLTRQEWYDLYLSAGNTLP